MDEIWSGNRLVKWLGIMPSMDFRQCVSLDQVCLQFRRVWICNFVMMSRESVKVPKVVIEKLLPRVFLSMKNPVLPTTVSGFPKFCKCPGKSSYLVRPSQILITLVAEPFFSGGTILSCIGGMKFRLLLRRGGIENLLRLDLSSDTLKHQKVPNCRR